MNLKNLGHLAVIASALIWVGATGSAWAQEDVDVSIDTSSLAGDTGSELFLELTGGGGDSGVGYNTVTTSPFVLGGGTAGTVDTANALGNVSGDMNSGVSLDDNGTQLSLFGQFLTPGTTLSFQMDLTTNVNTGPTPDGLFLYLYDPNGNPIDSTSDPSGFDSLLAVTFNSSTPVVTNFDSALLSVTPAAVAAAPEIDPSSALGALTLLAGALAVLRGRRRSPQREGFA